MKKILLVICIISSCIFAITYCDNTIKQNNDSKLLHESLLLNGYLLYQSTQSFLGISAITPSNDSTCSSKYDGTYDMVITLNGSLDGVTFGKVEFDLSNNDYIFTSDMSCPFICSASPLSFGTSVYPNDQIIINSTYNSIPDTGKYKGIRISNFKDIYGKIVNITDINYYLCTAYK